jgi:hypothetical protein
MRTAICLADMPSTSYFCLRKRSFLYSGVVQGVEYNVILGEDKKFAIDELWAHLITHNIKVLPCFYGSDSNVVDVGNDR